MLERNVVHAHLCGVQRGTFKSSIHLLEGKTRPFSDYVGYKHANICDAFATIVMNENANFQVKR